MEYIIDNHLRLEGDFFRPIESNVVDDYSFLSFFLVRAWKSEKNKSETKMAGKRRSVILTMLVVSPEKYGCFRCESMTLNRLFQSRSYYADGYECMMMSVDYSSKMLRWSVFILITEPSFFPWEGAAHNYQTKYVNRVLVLGCGASVNADIRNSNRFYHQVKHSQTKNRFSPSTLSTNSFELHLRGKYTTPSDVSQKRLKLLLDQSIFTDIFLSMPPNSSNIRSCRFSARTSGEKDKAKLRLRLEECWCAFE